MSHAHGSTDAQGEERVDAQEAADIQLEMEVGPGAAEGGGDGQGRTPADTVRSAFDAEDADLKQMGSGTWGRADTRTTWGKVVDFLPSLPFLKWGRSYTMKSLQGDLISGMIVTIMLVPQGMAYSSLAGLDPIYGLYSSTIPLLLYPIFGTSHELAVGPVAMAALLNKEAVEAIVGHDASPARFAELSHLLCFMSGTIQIVLGLMRAGYVVNFLSHPVLEGFVSAASIIIGSSQLSKVLGYSLPTDNALETIYLAFKNLGDIHWLTFGMAVQNIALLLAFQKFKATKFKSKTLNALKAVPGTLVVVVLNILLAWLLELDKEGLKVLGTVPSGLPEPVAPFDTESFSSDLGDLVPAAFMISLVGFMESVSVAKATSRPRGYDIDASQELVALGVSNLGGSFFRAFPVTGGLSRSVVNAQNAITMVSGLVTGVLIMLVLLLLTPLFEYLPSVTLAAIILVAVVKLFKIKEPIYFWRTKRPDFYVFVFAFVATLALGIELGILLGAGVSLLRVIKRSASPHWARLGRVPNTTTYRNCLRHREVILTPGIEIIRVDSVFYFANAAFVQDLALKAVHWTPNVKFLIMDMAPVANVDSSATHALEEMDKEVAKIHGVKLLYCTLRGPVRDTFNNAGYTHHLQEENRVFETVHGAVRSAREQLGLEPDEPDVPVRGDSESDGELSVGRGSASHQEDGAEEDAARAAEAKEEDAARAEEAKDAAEA